MHGMDGSPPVGSGARRPLANRQESSLTLGPLQKAHPLLMWLLPEDLERLQQQRHLLDPTNSSHGKQQWMKQGGRSGMKPHAWAAHQVGRPPFAGWQAELSYVYVMYMENDKHGSVLLAKSGDSYNGQLSIYE